MTRNKEINHKKSLWNLLFIVIALLCVTYIVMYGHSYSFFFSSLATISYIVLLFTIVGFQTVYFHISGNRWWHTALNAIVILAFFLPILIGTSTIQLLYEENQLSKFGTTTFGKVIGFESEYKRSGTTHYATLEYNFGNETYNQKIENNNNSYNINDSVKLLISCKDPELFKLFGARK
jgi:hypothetical protein